MSLCQLFLQSEAAYNCVSELGTLGMVEFKDLNPNVNAFQRRFVNEVRRCDEMERKLRFLEKEIKKEFIPILDTGDNPDAPQPREMIDLEATFEKLELELKDVNRNTEALKKTYSELTELRQILMKTQHFFDEVDLIQKSEAEMGDDTVKLLAEDGIPGYSGDKLGFVAGVIRRERLASFERMLWRVCRGNVFLRQTDIENPLEDPVTGDYIYKTVFIVFFQGQQLKSKIKKICEGFRASLYPCPEEVSDRREMIGNVVSRIEDLNTVLCQTTEHRHRILLASAKNIKNWFIKVRKMKAIYTTMNLFNFDVTQKCLIAECWCPNSDLDIVRTALRRATQRSGSSVPSILNRMDTSETPPTFNRTNKFTIGFQNIVDAYGVSNYREVNPAPFTIITFPFLFAVMFGDAGHGLIMMLFALWMVLKERSLAAQKSTNEIWLTFFNGRYIILLMGCFSIYTGMIYNDIFSKSINLFGFSWILPEPELNNNKIRELQYLNKVNILNPIGPNNQTNPVYPFGINPVWQISENKIIFLNSIKMKVSVILGVSQMLFGVALSCWNHVYFRKYSNIVFEFIPQIIFLMAIFGYMNGMIFAKWFKYSAIDGPNGSACAPSILITLINMFLYKYPDDPKQPCYLNTWYSGQKYFQTGLLLLALLCVPWMLVLKPWYLNRQNKRDMIYKQRTGIKVIDTMVLISSEGDNSEQAGQGGHGGHGGHEGEFDLGDVIIHQAIHTIEYCLGSISHTASYLRLWALSLAHAQLSEVLWTMVFTIGIKGMGFGVIFNGIIMYVVFVFWSSLTISVLLVMEGLSAFLHALRLHWVEFQSKFYTGSGFAFQPFAFDTILELAEKESAAEPSS
jgi:V-type H+-transporting ATPase subunit a